MHVDAELMGRLLLRLESDAHRQGWDGQPALFVLYGNQDADTDRTYRSAMGRWDASPARCGPYSAIRFAPPGALAGYPQHALFRLALNLSGSEHPNVKLLIEELRAPGFLGMAFLHEGWQRQFDDEEDEAAARRTGRRYADMPGSKEIRLVAAADIVGNDYWVDRVRGEKPKLWRSGQPSKRERIEGSIAESLRMVVAVVADLPRPTFTTTPTMWRWEDQPTES